MNAFVRTGSMMLCINVSHNYSETGMTLVILVSMHEQDIVYVDAECVFFPKSVHGLRKKTLCTRA